MKKQLFVFIAAIWFSWIVWNKFTDSEPKVLSRPVSDMIADSLINAQGKPVKLSPAQYYLFYFSAHWCPPCRTFTPLLAKFYKKNRRGGNFEVVFVSNDKNKAEMLSYMKQMPWNAVPFRGATANELTTAIGEKGIPNLVVVDAQGKTLFSSYENGDYLGPGRALASFKTHLKNRPLAVQAIELAKGFQNKQNDYLEEIGNISKSVNTKVPHKSTKTMVVKKRNHGSEEHPRLTPLIKSSGKLNPPSGNVRDTSVYTLNGIAGNGAQSHAIINGKLYSTGDSLSADTIIKEIHLKEVVLLKNGKTEILQVVTRGIRR